MHNVRTKMKEDDVPNRYNRMDPQEFSQSLDALGLSAGQFARLCGSQRKRVLMWLPDANGNVGEPVPHYAAVLIELLKLPGAMDHALRVTEDFLVERGED